MKRTLPNNRFLLVLVLLCAGAIVVSAEPPPHLVSVKKSPQGWQLLVDGQPFFIKGVGCQEAVGEHKEDYLLMAKEMGANAVRTWGVVPRSYFDRAYKDGLMVDAGIWFNPILQISRSDNYQDPGDCLRLKNEVLDYVRQMKNHPALLCWNMGNEVLSHTQDKAERRAFGIFLEDLIQAVHREDPIHPVVYTSDEIVDLPDLKASVPDLDIVGVSTYSDLGYIMSWLDQNNYDKPVIVTEFGTRDQRDRPRDSNGLPQDPFDQYKADDFVALWHQIELGHPRSLGGFAYILDEQRNLYSLTWFNINFSDLKREPYWTLYELYAGQKPPFHCPRIMHMNVSPSKLYPGDSFSVKAQVVNPDGDPVSYRYFITNIVSDPTFGPQLPQYSSVANLKEEGPGNARLTAPMNPGCYRVYMQVTDQHKNTAIGDRSLCVVP